MVLYFNCKPFSRSKIRMSIIIENQLSVKKHSFVELGYYLHTTLYYTIQLLFERGYLHIKALKNCFLIYFFSIIS